MMPKWKSQISFTPELAPIYSYNYTSKYNKNLNTFQTTALHFGRIFMLTGFTFALYLE